MFFFLLDACIEEVYEQAKLECLLWFWLQVDGSVSKDAVFAHIDSALTKLIEQKGISLGSLMA